MTPNQVSVAELFVMGRDIVQQRYNAEAVLELLDSLSVADLDVQLRGAVQHARNAAIDVFGGNGHTAAARSAMARVMALLEVHVGVAVS